MKKLNKKDKKTKNKMNIALTERWGRLLNFINQRLRKSSPISNEDIEQEIKAVRRLRHAKGCS